MVRPCLAAALAALVLLPATGPAAAADPRGRPDRFPVACEFLAACEDLGRFCRAEACGRDQIAAALACRVRCPGSAGLAVTPAPRGGSRLTGKISPQP